MVSQDSVYYRKEELKDYTLEELQTELKKRGEVKEKVMTRLEKTRELNPHLGVAEILDECPYNILPNLKVAIGPCCNGKCKDCWNTEYEEE